MCRKQLGARREAHGGSSARAPVDDEDERIGLTCLITGRVSQDSVHVEIIRAAPANGLLFSKLERRYVSIEFREAL
jgi:hypothetical protein